MPEWFARAMGGPVWPVDTAAPLSQQDACPSASFGQSWGHCQVSCSLPLMGRKNTDKNQCFQMCSKYMRGGPFWQFIWKWNDVSLGMGKGRGGQGWAGMQVVPARGFLYL